MKKFKIAGNWKMYKTIEESVKFIKELDKKINFNPFIETIIFAPHTSLSSIYGLSAKIKTGAQNFHYEEQGAFTGEISPIMLDKLVDFVLIGHSERRQLFAENDTAINKKIKTALKFGFSPLLCIGETLDERENNLTLSRLEQQLDSDLEWLNIDEIKKITIAYEPIWAIGTGKTASPEQAQEVHHHIRSTMNNKIGDASEDIALLYGGSVKPENCRLLLEQKDIDGLLIGGASLKVDTFSAIISISIDSLI